MTESMLEYFDRALKRGPTPTGNSEAEVPGFDRDKVYRDQVRVHHNVLVAVVKDLRRFATPDDTMVPTADLEPPPAWWGRVETALKGGLVVAMLALHLITLTVLGVVVLHLIGQR